MSELQAILGLVRQEVEEAVDGILTAATAGLQELSGIRHADPGAAERLETHLLRILETCAFQDLTGQRLDKLRVMLEAAPAAVVQPDSLLNGPAAPGQGLDQAAADRLLLDF
jgi:hypothetical protein